MDLELDDRSKWDFSEDRLQNIHIDGYLYKINDLYDEEALYKLIYIRKEIYRLAKALDSKKTSFYKKLYEEYFRKVPNYKFDEFMNGLHEFIDMSTERVRRPIFYGITTGPSKVPSFRKGPREPCARFLVSEVPQEQKIFNGISKPRLRFMSDGQSTGIDDSLRTVYRDIFINLSDPKLKELLYHELAHGLAGHITYRDSGNHQGDFKFCEQVLIVVGTSINCFSEL